MKSGVVDPMMRPASSEPAEHAAIVPKPDSAPAIQASRVRTGPISGQFSGVIG